METLGERMEWLIKLLGRTQGSFAALIGVTASTVSNWVNDKQNVTGGNVEAIANAIRVNQGMLWEFLREGKSKSDIESRLRASMHSAPTGRVSTVDGPRAAAANGDSDLTTLTLTEMSHEDIEGAREVITAAMVRSDPVAYRKVFRMFLALLRDRKLKPETIRWMVATGGELENKLRRTAEGLAEEFAKHILDPEDE